MAFAIECIQGCHHRRDPRDATSDVFRDKLDKVLDVTKSQQAIRKPLETGDIVGTVLFLATDHSRLTTGQTLMVDGGTVML